MTALRGNPRRAIDANAPTRRAAIFWRSNRSWQTPVRLMLNWGCRTGSGTARMGRTGVCRCAESILPAEFACCSKPP